jgi:hypothetical protein
MSLQLIFASKHHLELWIMLTDFFVAVAGASLISFCIWLFVFEPRRDIHDL